MYNKLSIIIPCYNEEGTIQQLLKKVALVPINHNIQKEIIVIDDASTDKTLHLIENFITQNRSISIQLIIHSFNQGKGACIRTGLKTSSGELIIIQDADLEYNPADYNKLIQPIFDGYADVVFGSRFTGDGPHRVLFFFHTIGNKFLTFLSNVLTQLNLTDMETGYKMFKRDFIDQVNIKENRFGFEPEITAKLSRIKNIRIYEVGIAYYGRTYSEGKKINWKDGLRAIYCIIKYNFFRDKKL